MASLRKICSAAGIGTRRCCAAATERHTPFGDGGDFNPQHRVGPRTLKERFPRLTRHGSATKGSLRCIRLIMTHIGKGPAWRIGTLLFGLSAGVAAADVPGHAYLGIAVSNVFRLRPPPFRQIAAPPAPLPKVMPVGITTILGDRRALLRVSFPARPPEPAKEVSCTLTVGQREGSIEVLDIDESARSVRLNNSGTVMVLTLAQDGPKLQSPPPVQVPVRVEGSSRAPVPPPLPAP